MITITQDRITIEVETDGRVKLTNHGYYSWPSNTIVLRVDEAKTALDLLQWWAANL